MKWLIMSHTNLRCLQIQLFSSLVVKELRENEEIFPKFYIKEAIYMHEQIISLTIKTCFPVDKRPQ